MLEVLAAHSEMISSYLIFFLASLLVVAPIWIWSRRRSEIQKYEVEKKASAESPESAMGTIEPLADFDWKKTAPLQFRPFKPIYYITMALKATAPSELIIIDSNYEVRMRDRQRVLKDHSDHVMGCIPAGVPAVREVYEYLLGNYLPARYPDMFTVSRGHDNKNETPKQADEKVGGLSKFFHNRIMDSSPVPLNPVPGDALEALRNLGENVEDDLFLLQQDPEEDGGEHRCVAFVCCHPSGFDPAEKLDKTLKEIHGPVPGYDKIGKSMERFFGRVEVGKASKRVNWAITTSKELFNLASNHVKEENRQEVQEDQEIDIDSTSVRLELQTLSRLPRTNALLFSFKTYLYPLRALKEEEGLGPALADAIEGLKHGNAPGMWTYKGGVRWGKSVCEYLRS